MGRLSRKRKRKAPPPPEQDIPEHIKKGDPVLYMLQRINYHHALLVECIVIGKPERYEKKLLDLFKSDAVRMEPRLSPPGPFSRYQVKFGITRNLPKRLEDINKDIFDSGVTEWRRISWIGFVIALYKFWWFRNSGIVWTLITLLFLAFWVWVWWEGK